MIKQNRETVGAIKRSSKNVVKIMNSGRQYFPKVRPALSIIVGSHYNKNISFCVTNFTEQSKLVWKELKGVMGGYHYASTFQYLAADGKYYNITDEHIGELYIWSLETYTDARYNASYNQVWNGEASVIIPLQFSGVLFTNKSTTRSAYSLISSDSGITNAITNANGSFLNLNGGTALVTQAYTISTGQFRPITVSDAVGTLSYLVASGSVINQGGQWYGRDLVSG